MLSNAYFLAKFRFDTAENEPAKNLQIFRKVHFRKMHFRKMHFRKCIFEKCILFRDLSGKERLLQVAPAGHAVHEGLTLRLQLAARFVLLVPVMPPGKAILDWVLPRQ